MGKNTANVTKRDGSLVKVSFDAIIDRIDNMSEDLYIDSIEIAKEVISKFENGISTSKIDSFTSQICHNKILEHPDFNVLAGRLIISDHQKNNEIMTGMKFSKVCDILYNNKDQLNELSPLISDELYEASQEQSELIEEMIDNDRDFLLDYFGFKTLYKAYLLKTGGQVVETPQHMFMRTALGIWGKVETEEGKIFEPDMDRVKETYDCLSTKMFTHATPTLYNSGTPTPQFFSCFLLGIDDDIESIFDVLKHCAQISKGSGGIGLHATSIRTDGSYIRGTGGRSDGIVPMLKVYNDVARYVNQGGGKRPGSFAMYLEPWHADIEDFLKCKIPHGKDHNRTSQDLFYALWIPDLFMERVMSDGDWSLMCPSECPGLEDAYGDEFKKLYESYEEQGRMSKKPIKARYLWSLILASQIETGTPYMCYKDAANKKSNQKNIGTINSSNLCSEIMEYSDTKKYACCVLGSMVLPSYVTAAETRESEAPKPTFNHQELYNNVRILARNLNRIIDINHYPVKETATSNFSERPIGIGVQGLHDVFFKLGLPYDSEEALVIDREIHETIYFAAMTESCALAKENGKPYETYRITIDKEYECSGCGYTTTDKSEIELHVNTNTKASRKKGCVTIEIEEEGIVVVGGKFLEKRLDPPIVKESPISQGKFQFDLWAEHSGSEIKHNGRWDWEALRSDIKKHGVYNSLVTALMPTASTSQIMGSASEGMEPLTNNCYNRNVKAGTFTLLNKYLANDLIKEGLWTEQTREHLLAGRGSIQNLDYPQRLKDLYKTSYELKQKVLIDHSLARGVYVDQSQSLNLYYEDLGLDENGNNTMADRIASGHMYGWKHGLKTGCYYTRTKAAVNSISFTAKQDAESDTESDSDSKSSEDKGYDTDCSACGA